MSSAVGTGIVGAPECGDVMKLQVKVQHDTIVDPKFKDVRMRIGNCELQPLDTMAEGKDYRGSGEDQKHRHRA